MVVSSGQVSRPVNVGWLRKMEDENKFDEVQRVLTSTRRIRVIA